MAGKQLIRHIKAISVLAFLPLILSLAGGCQDGLLEVDEPSPAEAFKANSTMADLLRRTSLRDGSADNIIDGSSCLTVDLPVTVVVNGIQLVLETQDDFNEVERILDASDSDVDTVGIIFPITITLPDYEKEVVEDLEELMELAVDCLEDGLDEDIECLDFKYPLIFSLFNTQNQVSDLVSVANDAELHQFLENLDENVFVSLNFPITVVLYTLEEFVVNSQVELENLITDVGDDCDEDDDNDFDEDDVDDTLLISTITAATWIIDEFVDGTGQTDLFEDMIFTFNSDGLLEVSGSAMESGAWTTFGDAGVLEVELTFPTSNTPFNLLQGRWIVVDFDVDGIEMVDDPNSDDPKILAFGRP